MTFPIFLLGTIAVLLALFWRPFNKTHKATTAIEGDYFLYKGIPVRKCRHAEVDENGNYVLDGCTISAQKLEAWYQKLNQNHNL